MKTIFLAAVAALAVAAPAQAATNFFNDWESTDFGSGAGFTILPSYEGWTDVTGVTGSGIEVQYNNVAGLAFSGENLVELDSNLNSAMERAIDAGSYTLSYYFSPRPGVAAASNGISVFVNGVLKDSITGFSASGTSWSQRSFTFDLAAPGTLRFEATGTSESLGGYLDDIRLSAVPEPATWAMMILGFGFVGASMRRRQSVRVSFA